MTGSNAMPSAAAPPPLRGGKDWKAMPAWTAVCGLAAAISLSGCKPTGAGGPPAERVVQVVVAPAERRAVSETMPLVGSLLADESVELKSETDGIVETVHFQEGQQVDAGDLLIELDDSKLSASLAESEATFQLSKANHDRNKQLFEERLISTQEFDQVASAFRVHEAGLNLKRRELRDTRVEAPFAGVVGARQVSPGQVITRNTVLTWLVDLEPIKVEVNVPEAFLGQLKIGQAIEVEVAAFPDRTFRGEVFFIAPFVDPETRTALVKARILNPERELLPGMFANLELTLEIREHSLVVPETALAKLLPNREATVFVRDRDSRAEARRVKVGTRMAGVVEIVEGLKEGEEVVVEGIQKLAPGVSLKLAPDAATGP